MELQPKLIRLLINILIHTGCFICLFIQSYNLIKEYAKYSTQVTQEDLSRFNLKFPTVTICVDHWTSKKRLCEYFNGKCSKKQIRLHYTVFHQSVYPTIRAKTLLKPEEAFNCTIVAPGTNCSIVTSCANYMKVTSQRSPLQMCYSLNIYEIKHLKYCEAPWLFELKIESIVKPKETMKLMTTEKIPILLTEPGVSPYNEISPIQLRQGYDHVVTFKQQIVKRLPRPFQSACTDYHKLGYQEGFFGVHNSETCVQDCHLQEEYKMCDCISYNYEFAEIYDDNMCLNFSVGLDYCKVRLQAKPEFEACQKKCTPACSETTYDAKLAKISDMKNVSESSKGVAFKVLLKFSTEMVSYMEFSPLISSETFLAYLGGTFGVWVGTSFMDLGRIIFKKLWEYHLRREERKRPMWVMRSSKTK